MLADALHCDNPECPNYFVGARGVHSQIQLRLDAEQQQWSSVLVAGGHKYSRPIYDFCPGCTDKIKIKGRHLIKEWIRKQ